MDALADRIIPKDDYPGGSEAGAGVIAKELSTAGMSVVLRSGVDEFLLPNTWI